MTKGQKTALIGLGVAIGVGITATGLVSAADGARNYPPMIESIIEKYNLNEEEVHDFIEENREELREERHAERETRFTENLSSAIENGKLTQEQADAWTAKHEEFKAQRTDMVENRGQVKGHREEMEQWMESQGINPADVVPEQQAGFGQGMGRGQHRN